MTTETIPVVVHILDKEYRIACPRQEREALLNSAAYLNDKMRDLRDSGKVAGADRVAVMVALNIVNDLFKCRSEQESHASQVASRIKILQNKVDTALNIGRQIEL